MKKMYFLLLALFMQISMNMTVKADDNAWSSVQLKSGDFSGYVKTSNPVFSPDGQTMYVPTSSPNGHLFAIDVATGVIKWVFGITELTYGGGALVGPDGTIYQGSDAAIYAVNLDGTQKWKIATSGAGALARVRAFPALSTDGTLYCVSNSTFYAITASSGTEKWTKPLTDGATIGSAVLVGGDGIIYVGTDKGMYAFNPADGSTKWSNTDAKLNVTESVAMAIHGNTLYVALKGTAGVAAINIADGSIKWNAGASGDAYFPIVDKNGVVYFTEKATSGNVYAINPDGTQKWVKNIGGSLNYGGLALDENGIIYGGTQSKIGGNYKVYAINTANEEFVFNNNNEQQLMGAFTIGPDKRVYYGTIGTGNIGQIQAFEINANIESGSWSIRGGNLQGTNCVKSLSTDATLQSLEVNQGTLTPSFAPDVFAYTVQVANTIESITVTGTANDGKAIVSGNVIDKALAIGDNTVTITVTAEDGIQTNNYEVTINRSNLTSISNAQQTSSYEINTKHNVLEVKANRQGTLTVYDVTGKTLFNKMVATGSCNRIPVSSHSVYLVKFNQEVAKVIIH